MTKLTIGITMGDAAGIGPEVIVKSLADSAVRKAARFVVIGDREHLERTAERLRIPLFVSRSADEGEIVDLANLNGDVSAGLGSAITGRAAGSYIETAVELWRSGAIDAVVTAPISKRSMALGGYDFPGHTEFIAALTGTTEFAMSFFAENLRVVLLSTHVPLSRAIELVTKDRVARLIAFTDRAISSLLGRTVRIAVAGLNPHASENGMFGDEEGREIAPAVAECEKSGIDVSGPYSPDTIFLRGYRGEFDAVVSCYHDQATIAVKCLSFGTAVNVTLGLPLIRTSVDHGTAFDIAGKGIADESSMKSAIELAAKLAAMRQRIGSAA